MELKLIKKIDEILNSGSLLSIIPLLTSKEDREEFIEIVSEKYGDKVNDKFWARLDAECAETASETEMRHLREDIAALKAIEEVKRVGQMAPVRDGVNEKISEISEMMSNGEYVGAGENFLKQYNPEEERVVSQKRSNHFREKGLEASNDLSIMNTLSELRGSEHKLVEELNKVISESANGLNNMLNNHGYRTEENEVIEDKLEKMRQEKITRLKTSIEDIRTQISYYEQLENMPKEENANSVESIQSETKTSVNAEKLEDAKAYFSEDAKNLKQDGVELPQSLEETPVEEFPEEEILEEELPKEEPVMEQESEEQEIANGERGIIPEAIEEETEKEIPEVEEKKEDVIEEVTEEAPKIVEEEKVSLEAIEEATKELRLEEVKAEEPLIETEIINLADYRKKENTGIERDAG